MTEVKTYFLQRAANSGGQLSARYKWQAVAEKDSGLAVVASGEIDLAGLVSETALENSPEQSHEQSSELLADLAENQVVLLASGAKTRCLTATMPPMSLSKLQQALPFAIEEQIASDIDDSHLAIFANDTNSGEVAAAVITKDDLKAELAPLKASDINLISCVPDYFLLPYRENSWYLALDPENCWLRYGQWCGLAVPTKDLALVLASLVREETKPAEIQISLFAGLTENCLTKVMPDFLTWLNDNSIVANISVHSEATDILGIALMHQSLPEITAANLLQGEFKVKPKRRGSIKLWYAVACAWCLVFVTLFGAKIYQYNALANKNAELQQQILEQYRRVFPGAPTANSPRIVFERELAQLQNASSDNILLQQLAALGTAMQQEQRVVLDNLSYVDKHTTVNLSVPNFTALEKMVADIEQQGMRVKKDVAVAKGERVQARIQISVQH